MKKKQTVEWNSCVTSFEDLKLITLEKVLTENVWSVQRAHVRIFYERSWAGTRVNQIK